MVPQDRPGPAINIIANFLSSQRNYSSFVNISINPKPLLNSSSFESFKINVLKRKHVNPLVLDNPKPDQIINLPGLTYNINFNQYSGFLNGSVRGNYLHYWYVTSVIKNFDFSSNKFDFFLWFIFFRLTESQSNPATDPLILWLMGGPGCSSVGSLLYENGPFWPNPLDGSLSVIIMIPDPDLHSGSGSRSGIGSGSGIENCCFCAKNT